MPGKPNRSIRCLFTLEGSDCQITFEGNMDADSRQLVATRIAGSEACRGFFKE